MNLFINLLILVVAAVIVFYLAKYIMGEAEIDAPLRKIILLILGVLFLLWLVSILAGGAIFPLIVVERPVVR